MNEQRPVSPELLEELSAFMDGELDAQRSRFLLQRLRHDDALRARWERWQLQAGALRKMAQPLPAGFSDKVQRAIDATPVPVRARVWQHRGVRWAGGLALAASLAVAATFVFDVAHTPMRGTRPIAVAQGSAPAPIVPIARTDLPAPEPAITLPIPVRAGVVSTFRLPLHPQLAQQAKPANSGFQPFPQPYAIDPELEAYLRAHQAGGSRDVFRDDAAGQDGNGAVRTVSWPDGQ
ncbi:MAG: sigma-E factor negative regulatory protein [Proteobacteria bacterium]|nr:sigma-E factor negative regulatory protein [Pseudomonadota bacterium]